VSPPGGVELIDGIHRWAVADQLGIDPVPVEMKIQTESPFAFFRMNVPSSGSPSFAGSR
jgi:hypothetical protein